MDQKVLQVNQEESAESALSELNISPNDLGAVSKEVAERILHTKDTNYIHQVMYVPIEKKEDLEWLIRCVGEALADGDGDEFVLEIADLLYSFVLPFYAYDILGDHHLHAQTMGIIERLALRDHSDIQTLIHDMKIELAVSSNKKSL
ncbi:hypothetical protein [Bacillus sp. 179-C3.3 HS]|uniref:hypothetical protein n=1 Tax=Bacillus sp. 179-C3.3 HS TaxID=3232162 RepID=UPI0039A15281